MLRMALKTLRREIWQRRYRGKTWKEIGELFGKSAAWAWRVANGDHKPPDQVVEEAMRRLPRELWKTTPELEAAVLVEIRQNHVGLKRAIKSRYLARQLGTTDRMVRACVNALRKRGYPICSSVGRPAGFYWPSSMREYKEFEWRDYTSRIRDMEDVRDAMRQGAEALFEGRPIEVELQPELILQQQDAG